MFQSTTSAARAASTTPPLPARAAVETVRIGSAGLSASYYAMLGLTVHPLAAVGLGLIAGAADYIKSNALGAVIDGPGIMRRLIALPLFFVLFIASMIAVDGVLLKLRDALVSGPANVITGHDRASADHKAAADELARLGAVRTPDAISADMDAAPVSRAVFRRTSNCTDITKDASFDACKPILDLRQEMASAIRKRELEAARDKAAKRLDELGPRPSSADPQAEAVAHAAGVSVSTAAWVLIAIVGFAIELCACFGLYVLGEPSGGRRRSSGRNVGRRTRDHPGQISRPGRSAGRSEARKVSAAAGERGPACRCQSPHAPEDPRRTRRRPDVPQPSRTLPCRWRRAVDDERLAGSMGGGR